MELGNGALLDLDATATLAVAEREVAARRRQGVERLQLLLHWADLHSEDPQARPGAVPLSRGGDRLVELGGEGTPEVSELCWAELAIALETGVVALRNQAGQALDLRHRLPLLWALVQELWVEPWVAQKVAAMTRGLTRDQAGLVDTALAAAVDESPGRMLGIAEAKTIEADPEGYRARLVEDERRLGVWLSRPKPGDLVDDQAEPGTRRLSSKRTKTHDGYTVDQLGLGVYRWVTRHGLARIVTPAAPARSNSSAPATAPSPASSTQGPPWTTTRGPDLRRGHLRGACEG